jgi:hypothetical protein
VVKADVVVVEVLDAVLVNLVGGVPDPVEAPQPAIPTTSTTKTIEITNSNPVFLIF